MELGLGGKRAAVAASSGGLGFAAAAALAAEGARVAICGRDQARLAEARDRLAANGPEITALVADVSSPEGAEGFVHEAEEALGGVDILVANAGGPPPGTFSSTGIDDYRAALDLNLLSTVAMCRRAIPSMTAAGWGRVVAITSIGARQPIANLMASVTARAGVTGFLKVLSSEVAPRGVTVNSLQPGIHRTDRLASLHEGDLDRLVADVPTRTVGDPADFGAIVAFLCSEQARFVTGTALPVDGGATRGI